MRFYEPAEPAPTTMKSYSLNPANKKNEQNFYEQLESVELTVNR